MIAPRAPAGISGANAALFDAFATHLAARPPHTRSAYLRDVTQLFAFAGETPVETLERPQLMRFVATMHGRGLSGRSLARTLSAWRAFYRFLIERNRTLKDDPCAGIKAPKSPRRLPAALSPEEAAKLVTIDGEDPLAMRDRALFELAYSSGLRLSELAQLDIAGCDLATGEVRVLGKGSKERIVPVGSAARDAVTHWLAVRRNQAAPDEPAMFTGRHGRR
jgi:integrase/recombinase XerC